MNVANRPGKREREETRKGLPPQPVRPLQYKTKSIASAVGVPFEAPDHDRD